MKTLESAQLSQVYGGVNVFSSAKVGAQIGAPVGALSGGTLAFVMGLATENLPMILLGWIPGSIVGSWVGGFAGAAIMGGTALVYETQKAATNALYS